MTTSTTYFLQKKTDPDYVKGSLDDRLVIDTKLLQNYECINTCEANSWLEAKQKFDMFLTPLQEELLESQK
jgi:hypothetical protein